MKKPLQCVSYVSALIMVCSGLAAASADAVPADFGFENTSVSLSTTQAGAHPDVSISFRQNRDVTGAPIGLLRNLSIGLPPGLIGNPTDFPHCSNAELANSATVLKVNKSGCPQDSQVGITEVEIFDTRAGGSGTLQEPIYLMESPGGDTVARLGFVAVFFPTVINVGARSASDYGLTATVEGISTVKSVMGATTILWGVPAAPSHDADRITPYESYLCSGKPCTAPGGSPRASGLLPRPFMTNPTHCGNDAQVTFESSSYTEPSHTAAATAPFPALTGCGSLSFEPKLSVAPTSHRAGGPTGLDVSLELPQDETVGGRATAQLRDATVTLPEGMTIASGAGDELEACSATQVGYQKMEQAHCPNGSKIGSVEFDVPALEHVLSGAIYQRTPEPGDLFRIWLVADELGVHVKIPGEIKADPLTGQITSTFVDNPQVPLREIQLHLFGGPRAPLANPPMCGTYRTEYEFVPWSGTAPVRGSSPMAIDESCRGGGFSPTLSAGSVNPVAGDYSSFVLDLGRSDREQNISGLTVALPLGLTAKLAGVPLCLGSAALSGNCPAASQIGSVAVAAGPGSNPLWIPQPGKEATAVYLSGPYEGAPYSLVVKVPAQAGPFDLGTVVTRAAIFVDRSTAQVSVKSDPLPQILEGVPVFYRDIRVTVDRPDFMLNPTSCEGKSVAARVTSPSGVVANPIARYQVGDCASLAFKPRMTLKLKGGTRRTAHPQLIAQIISQGTGVANLSRVQVKLPRSAFLDQAHIRTICTRVQFVAKQCPAAAQYGFIKAWTPLLEEPLEGPVYLRSSNHKLPDLVFDLHGPLDIEVVARIDSVHGGIRATVEEAPDAPLSKVLLKMQGQKKGLIVNSKNLCASTNRASVAFEGHNGKTFDVKPVLRPECGGGKRKHKRHHG
jgi:hypothetical protein